MAEKYQWVTLGDLINGVVEERGKCAHLVLRKREDKARGFSVCSLKGVIVSQRPDKPKCKKCLANAVP